MLFRVRSGRPDHTRRAVPGRLISAVVTPDVSRAKVGRRRWRESPSCALADAARQVPVILVPSRVLSTAGDHPLLSSSLRKRYINLVRFRHRPKRISGRCGAPGRQPLDAELPVRSRGACDSALGHKATAFDPKAVVAFRKQHAVLIGRSRCGTSPPYDVCFVWKGSSLRYTGDFR